MIEYVKITGNRHPQSFEPSDRHCDRRVIHVLARISVAVDRDDSLMTRSFSDGTTQRNANRAGGSPLGNL